MDASTPAGHRHPDQMDRAAGLRDGGEVFSLRDRRPEFLHGAESCHHAVLSPSEGLDLSGEFRRAVARRVAGSGGNPNMMDMYGAPFDDPDLLALAKGDRPRARLLRAVARHVDLIATDPGKARRADLEALQAAGLTVAQIVALSELLGYLSFQVVVAHGLGLLEQSQ